MKNFRLITQSEVSKLKDKINSFTENDWNEFDFRQKTFDVHKQTQTIPVIFDTDFRGTNPTYLERSSFFADEINLFKTIFEDVYGPGELIRMIIVKLKSNSSIAPHIDSGDSLEKCSRVHIPVITNSKVFFTVGGETKILKEGEFWEINNSGKVHSVENKSTLDRVHVITDWIKM